MAYQAYFESGGEGDWYNCLLNTAPAESPTTAPSKWSKLEIPHIFENVVALYAVAYILAAEGQNDKFRAQMAVAQEALDELRMTAVDRGDVKPSMVLTR